MNIHFGNQSQFELFPGTTGEPIENSAPRFIFSRIVLTFENLVVVFVFVIVSLIIAFSFGVENGRLKAYTARPVAIASAPAQAKTSVIPHPQLSVISAQPIRKPAAAVATAEAAREIPPPAPVVTPVAARPAPPSNGDSLRSQKGVDKGYTVQVASYKKESMADKEAADLKRQGLQSFVMQKGDYSIICVGKFTKQDQAKQTLSKLKKRYKDSVIRSL